MVGEKNVTEIYIHEDTSQHKTTDSDAIFVTLLSAGDTKISN